MKCLRLFISMLSVAGLAGASSCGHSTMTPAQSFVKALAFVRTNAIPQTIHVIPFFNYGKKGYQGLNAPGGDPGLIGSETALYGETEFGGSTTCSTPFNSGSTTGCGIVYRLTPNKGKQTYKLKVLHTFQGAPADGAASFAELFADKSGDLYGTTFYGGAYDGGTLFKLHPTGSRYTETIVHSFGYGQDGAYPISGVIEVNGVLYGTTIGGGAYTNQIICKRYGLSPNGTCGTIYSVNPATGAEQVLHSFGQTGDGANPYAAPLAINGTLYGTTYLGGTSDRCGTVYSIGTDGNGEKVVHSFLNAMYGDGCDPFGSLITIKGTLYGTTCCGGGNFCQDHCEGTLFSVDLATGNEQVLHEFGKGKDGSEPQAGLVNVGGVLYGTTHLGGKPACDQDLGCGTIFSFAPSPSNAVYKTVYDFKGRADGGNPWDTLLYAHGAFYGTTTTGGKNGLGTGVKLPL